jgi:hypothetical protein
MNKLSKPFIIRRSRRLALKEDPVAYAVATSPEAKAKRAEAKR